MVQAAQGGGLQKSIFRGSLFLMGDTNFAPKAPTVSLLIYCTRLREKQNEDRSSGGGFYFISVITVRSHLGYAEMNRQPQNSKQIAQFCRFRLSCLFLAGPRSRVPP